MATYLDEFEVLDALEGDLLPMVGAMMRRVVANIGSELTEFLDVVDPVERAMALRGVPILGSLFPQDHGRSTFAEVSGEAS